MRIVAIAAATALLFAGAFVDPEALHAAPPELESSVMIRDGAEPLSVDGYSAPDVVDWNNDGRKDLVIGQFTFGYIWVYLNQGTDLNPVFDGGAKVLSEGVPITTTYG